MRSSVWPARWLEALRRPGVRDTSELDLKKVPAMEEHRAGAMAGGTQGSFCWLCGASSLDWPGLCWLLYEGQVSILVTVLLQ